MIIKDLGKPLAVGRTAELFPWQGGWVLKLFHNWFELENILFEQRMAQAVHASGLPVPMAGEVIQVNGRNGLLYERVDGQNIWDVLQRQPWRLFALARQTAQLHAEMHANILQPGIPPQRHRLENRLRGADPLPDSFKRTLVANLSALPDGNRICHGDFHPGNILITSTRAVIIDWIDASRGNPLADVARTTVIILGATASSQIPSRILKAFVHLFHSVYLHRYFQLRPGSKNEYRRWLPVVAAARLCENIPELEGWLLEQVYQGLR
jgi:Ser/Thr protein kinase RdoA (MazF antagonist)